MSRAGMYVPHPSHEERIVALEESQAYLENEVAGLRQQADTDRKIIEAQQEEIERLRKRVAQLERGR